jgi:hypothetical protein
MRWGSCWRSTPTAEDRTAGHKQLIEQAHTRGLKILGATLTPFYGAVYYTEVGETKRNEWIRTGKAYDAVIDFDKATRDQGNPKMFCRYTIPATTSIQAMPVQGDGRRHRPLLIQAIKDCKRALLQHGATLAICPMSAAGRTPRYDIDYPPLPKSQLI